MGGLTGSPLSSDKGPVCRVDVPTYRKDGTPTEGVDLIPCDGIVHYGDNGIGYCDKRGHQHRG